MPAALVAAPPVGIRTRRILARFPGLEETMTPAELDQLETMTPAELRAFGRAYFKTMGRQYDAEIQKATAHYSDAMRAAMSPEMCRQRGEFRRLWTQASNVGGGDPVAFLRLHRGYIDAGMVAAVRGAMEWGAGFLREYDGPDVA